MHCCHRSRSLPHHCFFLLALHYLPLVTQIISSSPTATILKTEAFTPITTTSPLSSLSLKSFNFICNCSNQRLCCQYQYQSKRKRLHPELGNSPHLYRYSYDKSFHTMAKSRKEGEEEAETLPSNNNNYGGENMKQTLKILNTKQSSSSSLSSIFTSILLKYLWTIITKLSTRKVIRLLSKIVSAYSDTVFYFPTKKFDCFTSICKDGTKKETRDTKGEKDEGLFAITIDDGLCRSSSPSSSSYIPQIAHTLSKYNAQATFFVCSDYTVHNPTIVQQARTFLRECGEFACHMKNDADAGYYVNMDKNEWEEEFRGEWKMIDWLMNGKGDVWSEEEQSSSEEIETKSTDDKNGCNSTVSKENQTIINDENENSKTEIRWFRSPQGLFTSSMQSTLHSLSSSSSPNKPHKNVKYIHVLGDAYCDDWKLSSYDSHFVASTMLQQIQPGSIAIFHMPEEGFRQDCLNVLDMVLQGAKERNLRGIMLSKLWERQKK